MRALAIIAIFSLSTFAQQPKSGIQFWDTTGTNQTAKVGWTGDASNGNFYIEMPNNKNITAKDGNVSVTGEMTATKFNGSGAGLTNLPETDPTVPAKIAAINDSLKRKADTTKVNPLWTGGTTGQAWKKTATGYGWANDSVGSTGTAGVTQITPGAGISVSPAGGTGNVTVNAKFAGTGTKDSVARSDHTHANYIGATGVTFENLNANGDVGANADQVAKGDHAHSNYIGSAGVTFENLNTNGDVGSNADQVARGDHNHDSRYYIKSEIDGLLGADTAIRTADGSINPIYSNTPTTIKTVTITAPSNGFVLVWANATVRPYPEDASISSSINYCAIFCTISNTPSATTDPLMHTAHWANGRVNVEYRTLSMVRMFPVAAGQNTFYFNFWKPAPETSYLTPAVVTITMAALFVKSQL
jgi:hypothetical protein